MERENTYGRKVIRQSSSKSKKAKFWLYLIIIAALSFTIGFLFSQDAEAEEPEVTTSEPKIEVKEQVKKFGAYDDRILTSEISLEWSSDDDFIPLDCPMDEETQEFVFYLCDAYDIDWTLVMAMIQKESNFTSDVVSKTNDYGLMQINKCNHEWLSNTLGITNYLDPEQNIRAGVFVLRKLFEKHKEPELVLMCYNMGEGGASKLWNKGVYSTKYSESILEIQKGFINQLEGKEGVENEAM